MPLDRMVVTTAGSPVGIAAIANALADNLPARIPLERPLSVAVDQALRITLFQDGATQPRS